MPLICIKIVYIYTYIYTYSHTHVMSRLFLEADTQTKIKVSTGERGWGISRLETNFSWYTSLYCSYVLSHSNITFLKILITNKIPYNKVNAFHRKNVQNHFKDSERLPGLRKSWLKALTFLKKECVNQNWCLAVNEGERKECRSRGHRSGPKYFKFCIPFCEGSPIMEIDASGKLSLMPFNILNAELSALALIPRSPSKLPVIICSPL